MRLIYARANGITPELVIADGECEVMQLTMQEMEALLRSAGDTYWEIRAARNACKEVARMSDE